VIAVAFHHGALQGGRPVNDQPVRFLRNTRAQLGKFLGDFGDAVGLFDAQFSRVAKKLVEWGVPVDARIEESYFSTKVMTPAQYQSMVQLLTIFAQHLSMVANQVAVQQDNAELPMITRAKSFIKSNQAEDLSLGQVAKAVNTSTFYFCKMFKKATGLNFTEYLSRVRIEKAKNLLLNPNLRISEIAFEVGFQSLTHFNRVFKRVVGQSPTEYRVALTPS